MTDTTTTTPAWIASVAAMLTSGKNLGFMCLLAFAGLFTFDKLPSLPQFPSKPDFVLETHVLGIAGTLADLKADLRTCAKPSDISSVAGLVAGDIADIKAFTAGTGATKSDLAVLQQSITELGKRTPTKGR